MFVLLLRVNVDPNFYFLNISRKLNVVNCHFFYKINDTKNEGIKQIIINIYGS